MHRLDFGGELPGGKRGRIGHVDAEEQEQCLAVSVAGRYAPYAIVLLLIAETALHDCCAEVANDSTRGRDVGRFVLGPGAFADEIGGDAIGRAIRPVVVIGIDGVHTYAGYLHARQRFLIFNALFQPRPFVEGFEGMVLDERDAVDLYVVDLGAEFDTFVLLPSHNGTYIRTVDADDASLHFLSVVVVGLLAVHLFYGGDAFMLLGTQDNQRGILAAQAVPKSDDFTKQVEKPLLHPACGRFPGFALFGVCKAGLVDIAIFTARQPLALFPAYLLQKRIQPLAAFPHQLDVGRISKMTFVAGGVAHAQILVFKQRLPLLI